MWMLFWGQDVLDGGVCKKIKYLLLNFDLGDGTGPLEDGVSHRENKVKQNTATTPRKTFILKINLLVM